MCPVAIVTYRMQSTCQVASQRQSQKVFVVSVRCRTQDPVYLVCSDTRKDVGSRSRMRICSYGAVQVHIRRV